VPAEEGAKVADQQVRCLHRWEVAAAVELRPVIELSTGEARPTSDPLRNDNDRCIDSQ
jgi:hypothetical protein